MTENQWMAIERSLDGLSDTDVLEVIGRLSRSIRDRAAGRPDRVAWQRENLHRLLGELLWLPGDEAEDGLSNRDHDKILYGERA